MSAAALDEAGVLRVIAMVDAIRAAGLATEAEMFETVYWGWLRIAQAYVCAHPYVGKPEPGGMTPLSALGVVNGRWLRSGAGNISASGLRQQDNDMVLIDSPALAAGFERNFERNFERIFAEGDVQ